MSGTSDNLSFSGKIAVITADPSVNEDDFHSADQLREKYGNEKIIHIVWQDDIISDQDKMIDALARLAEDREIKVLIITQAVPGTNAALDKLKETRDDVFVVCCAPQENAAETALHANLVLKSNEAAQGSAMVKQAKNQGAKVFIHYSFPRHMTLNFVINRREMIRQTCEAEGILFVDATTLDPSVDASHLSAQQHILEDVPKLIAKYGEDTAFFCTNCALQIPLIKAIVENHAIYPQPCCPSPYHGFPEALGIDISKGRYDLYYIINEASRIAAEKNMTDRLSTWPVSIYMMFANAGAEYAIKWINNEVSHFGIVNDVLMDCMNTYIENEIGEESCVFLDSYSEGGTVYHNIKMVLMSYLDF